MWTARYSNVLVLTMGIVTAVVAGCKPTPTAPSAASGLFPLSKWNGLSLPVNMGFVPPDTCARQMTTGSLMLDASRQTFTYSYRVVNCRGADAGSDAEAGTYVQKGDSLSFAEPNGARFTGTVMADRIVVTAGSTFEFLKT